MALIGRKRARTGDREEAVELINAAYAEGQLTTDQREDRVHRALVATHLGDLQQITSDLQPGEPAALAPQGRWQRMSRRTKLGIAAAVLALGVGGVFVAEQIGGNDSTSVSEQESYVVPATADAVEGLIADQMSEFGTTKSYGISLQSQLSTLRVPTGDEYARYQEWSPVVDGSFEANGDVRGAGDQIEFDLADVDLDALARHIATARATLDVAEPAHTILVIHHWAEDDQPTISITISNEFEETGYLVTDLAGKVLERRAYDPASP